jgi:hypothetical protein
MFQAQLLWVTRILSMNGLFNRQIAQGFARVFDGMFKFLLRIRWRVAYILLILSVLSLWGDVSEPSQGDVLLYQNISDDALGGKLPYRDRVLEYPPYSMLVFLLPRLFSNYGSYPTAFIIMVLFLDWLLKIALIIIGFNFTKGIKSFLPFCLYSSAVLGINFFYLQRYDIWPTLASILALWSFSRQRYFLSGLLLAFGIGIKLYPIIFVPPLFIIAFRLGGSRRFFLGVLSGMTPLVCLSFFLPWWRFAEFQGARGLQVESLYASALWLAKLLGYNHIDWVWVKAWFEVKGSMVTALLPWIRLFFSIIVISSVAFVCYIALKMPIRGRLGADTNELIKPPTLARLFLVPLLSFVAFNQVLSPQYMIWILPLAAVLAIEKDLFVALLLVVATWLTPFFFPTLEYITGLNLRETIILLFRNIILVTVWFLLIMRLLMEYKDLKHDADCGAT